MFIRQVKSWPLNKHFKGSLAPFSVKNSTWESYPDIIGLNWPQIVIVLCETVEMCLNDVGKFISDNYGLHFWPIWSAKVTQWGSSVKYRCSGSISRLLSYRSHFVFDKNHKDKTEIRCRRQPWWPALENSSRPELGFKWIWILLSIDNKNVADLF